MNNSNFFYHPLTSIGPSSNPYFFYATSSTAPNATASPPVLVAPSGATFSASVSGTAPTLSLTDIGMGVTLAAFVVFWLWAVFRR